MADGGEPAVEVDHLTKRYGDLVAVDDLSLRAGQGQVTAVLGPNGAGKTTTVETCEGFRRPDAGSVRVLGLDPVADGPQLRARVGVMLQAGGVYPAARPGELLRTLASCYAHPLPVDALLDALGLARVARTPYRRLSGGEQRRLALAMALVGRPEVVFLDEPTAGLDPQARHATWDVIANLRKHGAGVLLTTHYLDEAERLADHVVIIDHGTVLAAATPAELTGAGRGHTLTFRAVAGLDVDDLAATLPEGTTAHEDAPGHYRVQRASAAVDPQILAAVTAWCAQRGVLAEDVNVGRRTLEDVFLELTGKDLRT
ncbi:MAG: ATP-binding cassette domain-containing protein [Streptosporangiales bacterium]|nr:ATP-binding cassette domain-containing protein [Streptosporangiales bacterium]